MENKTIKNLLFMFGIGVAVEVAMLIISSVAFTYSWFSATVTEKDVKDQVVETGTLSLRYVDGPEIKMKNIRPGTTITKTVYVANTGTLDASYNLVWQELTNEITKDELVLEATCTRMDAVTESESGTCDGISSTAVGSEKIKTNVSIEPNIVHKYDITITFKEINAEQNYNQGKNFNGVLGVNEYKESNTPVPIYCTYDGTVEDKTVYSNGAYMYTYSKNNNGWMLRVANALSTDPITEAPCTYVNDLPITSMYETFWNTYASSIDVSKFYTKNVTNMYGMFMLARATEIKGLENFDTSSVTNMAAMFYGTSVATLDLSNFDTSNVTAFDIMFLSSTKLNKIYAGDKFIINSTATSKNMFNGITGIIGGNGTAYDETHVDAEYARIDGLNGLPGYFTAK